MVSTLDEDSLHNTQLDRIAVLSVLRIEPNPSAVQPVASLHQLSSLGSLMKFQWRFNMIRVVSTGASAALVLSPPRAELPASNMPHTGKATKALRLLFVEQ